MILFVLQPDVPVLLAEGAERAHPAANLQHHHHPPTLADDHGTLCQLLHNVPHQ
jgi:hypothetical protein